MRIAEDATIEFDGKAWVLEIDRKPQARGRKKLNDDGATNLVTKTTYHANPADAVTYYMKKMSRSDTLQHYIDEINAIYEKTLELRAEFKKYAPTDTEEE